MVLRLQNDFTTGLNTLTLNNEEIPYIYPNPFTNHINFEYRLFKAADVNISINNMQGRLIRELIAERRNEGLHQDHFSLSGIASGTYLLQLKADEKVIATKIIKQ
jgi:hypothetical protein